MPIKAAPAAQAPAAKVGAAPQPLHAPTQIPPLKVPAPAPAPVTADPKKPAVPPAAGPAQLQRRHYGIAVSFVAVVIIPTILAIAYLFALARDQYASTMSFSVRTEEFQSSLDLLGGITKLSGSAGNDIDILSEFIMSQQMVQKVAQDVDLAAAFAEGWPSDFVFAFNDSGSIEDLHKYWKRKVELNTNSGLVQIRVHSYDPLLSNAINEAIFNRSSDLVNTLSAEARLDATRFTAEELKRAEERLATARETMTAFRLRTQIVDPASAAQSQLGVLNTLNAQLADELIKLDLLKLQGQTTDPRTLDSERRIQAIRNRVAEEQAKFGPGGQGPGGENYSTLFAQYERYAAERLFAEEAYRVAQVSHDSAQGEAQRKSRYIVAHVPATFAESSTYPKRLQMSFLTLIFMTLIWSMGLLIYYSVRDRR
ncbi:MAG: hypothetical protein ACK4VZ_01505 [Paracoccaceae bacterium]